MQWQINTHKMNKKIRILTVVFEPEIRGRDIPLFRGAVIQKAGADCVLFHNHQNDSFRYSYPLIQYKRINHHAAIVCVDQGVDEIYRLFNQPDWKVRIGREETELKIIRLYINSYTLNVWEKFFTYKIFNWLPLNEKNFRKYLAFETDEQRTELLKSILIANILSFAKGVGWVIEPQQRIQIKDFQVLRKHTTYFKGNKLMAFDAMFSANVFLPPNIGLGKAPSHGFGRVVSVRNQQKRTDSES